MKGELNRTIMVYVDSVTDQIPSGQYHIASKPEAQPFHGFCRMLIDINRDLDREQFPQSYAELRMFQKPVKQADAALAAAKQKSGKVATFFIRVLFRQNASWQGSVTWVEGNQEAFFRSVLELMVLMENAVGYAEEA